METTGMAVETDHRLVLVQAFLAAGANLFVPSPRPSGKSLHLMLIF